MTEKYAYCSTVPRNFVHDCRLKTFNLNLILTCNINIPPMGEPKQLDTPTAQAAANISVFLDSF